MRLSVILFIALLMIALAIALALRGDHSAKWNEVGSIEYGNIKSGDVACFRDIFTDFVPTASDIEALEALRLAVSSHDFAGAQRFKDLGRISKVANDECGRVLEISEADDALKILFFEGSNPVWIPRLYLSKTRSDD